ncbi:glycerol-3-phosphate dehydrogenase/oxidase (plasmid) [Photobacterium sp. GJ3]|uniref:glycerol-3-phosphate dehydrogenase/oxidase n=1 Tax=Photobacterium sp. GJ3 TaxID=2829502 RepID=UPI001B8C0B58|nr:glycerol-3-phosphate dehydrogenase/oxidase [Photobacterium sp. GJ3]QUJ69992.1 glycerol-3-phosphate dehydrogenase/oxidase [Photobacterium sp. GJ3]
MAGYGKENRQGRLPREQSFDVVIVGGGINGISVYRELSLQGVKVLLVEKDDFCSKASAALSRMIHGGLRYLENGEFALVRESLAERNRLLTNAPHVVKPLVTTIPIFSRWSGLFYALFNFTGLMDKPSRRGALVIQLGLWFYDFFTRNDQQLPKHRFLSKTETIRRWPHFEPGVIRSADYFDAWISAPERLAMEVLQDTGEDSASVACNYTELVGRDGKQLTIRDVLTGETAVITTDKLVNATGAWVDQTNDRLGVASGYLQGTKGSHMIVRHPALLAELDGHMVFYENPEGRVCILFPYFGNVLIGSTDIPVADPDAVTCTTEEVDYMLDSLKAVFPDFTIRHEDIVYRFSGVRPLPSVKTSTTGQIPRSHALKVEPTEDGQATLYSLVGGKWTTFRAFGAEVADRILSDLHRKREISTVNRAIGGGFRFPQTDIERQALIQDVVNQYGLSQTRFTQLLTRYGTSCLHMLDDLTAQQDAPLESLPDYSEREIAYLIHHESVCRTLDVLQRRTSVAIQGRVNHAVLAEVTALVARQLGWNAQETKRDLAESCRQLREYHGLDVNAEAVEQIWAGSFSGGNYVYQ